MEYIYGFSTYNGNNCENLKTIGTEHSNLSGYISTIKEFSDGTRIEDKCYIVKKYASKEVGGIFYDWYIISNHYRDTDTSKKAEKDIDSILIALLGKE